MAPLIFICVDCKDPIPQELADGCSIFRCQKCQAEFRIKKSNEIAAMTPQEKEKHFFLEDKRRKTSYLDG